MLTFRRRQSRQRGLSLVELMVGIAMGMFIVAAASTLVITQLSANRRLLLEVQVQQDLRATADIITRELRRAGSISQIANADAFVWTPGTSWVPDVALSVVTPAAGTATAITFRSSRTQGQSGPYGFRRSTTADGKGVIESELALAGWQQLTDPATMDVTSFTVTTQAEPALVVACSKLCADSTQSCWPRVTVRAYAIDITGRAATDPSVLRSVRSVVRLKNDLFAADAALGARTCPA